MSFKRKGIIKTLNVGKDRIEDETIPTLYVKLITRTVKMKKWKIKLQ